MLTIYINYTTEYGEAPSQVSVSIENETEFTFTEEYLPELTADGYQFDGWMLDGSLIRVGDVSNIISIDTTFELVAHWTQERNYWGNATGGFGVPKSFVVVDESGNEFTAVTTEDVTIFTATDNDVREGSIYASEHGISTGTKKIPAYHTNEGKKIIMPNSAFQVHLPVEDAYDFTALQVLICAYNTSITDSVATDRVGINTSLYPVQSTDLLANITKDEENKIIDLGIVNNTENKFVIRFFTYKECY